MVVRVSDHRGYTLVELIVAVTVLVVGVLAVAGTAAPVARLVRWGGAQSASAAAASSAIEALRAGGCAALVDGTAIHFGSYQVRWTVASSGPAREVRVLVSYPWGPLPHHDVYETSVACLP
jgi:prepilin-type N-terminal cleavage/methylation domain-containing protein